MARWKGAAVNQKTYPLLPAPEAEKLPGALGACSSHRPEQAIDGKFEFAWPQRLLKECLDALELTYEYEETEGVF